MVRGLSEMADNAVLSRSNPLTFLAVYEDRRSVFVPASTSVSPTTNPEKVLYSVPRKDGSTG